MQIRASDLLHRSAAAPDLSAHLDAALDSLAVWLDENFTDFGSAWHLAPDLGLGIVWPKQLTAAAYVRQVYATELERADGDLRVARMFVDAARQDPVKVFARDLVDLTFPRGFDDCSSVLHHWLQQKDLLDESDMRQALQDLIYLACEAIHPDAIAEAVGSDAHPGSYEAWLEKQNPDDVLRWFNAGTLASEARRSLGLTA